MKRVAIIIGNEGKMRNFLPGVSKDMTNFKKLLLSDVGGAWEENEIISSKFWSTSSLKREIDRQKSFGTDYFFIIFSGHGYAIKNNDTFFELAENDDLALGTLKRWVQFKKTLIIADSCRKYLDIIEKAHVESYLRTFYDNRSILRTKYRTLYDNEIDRLEAFHNTFIASTNLDECAEDTEEGGLYTKKLLDLASSVAIHGRDGVYTIKNLHEVISSQIAEETHHRQTPQIYSTSTIQSPPFIVKPRIF